MKLCIRLFIIFGILFVSLSAYAEEDSDHIIKYYKAKYYKRKPGYPQKHRFVNMNERYAFLKPYELQSINGNIKNYDKITYDSKYNIVKGEKYSDGKLKKTFLITYDEYGREKTLEYFDGKDNRLGIWRYTYDANGSKSDAHLYNANEKKLLQRWNYFYHTSGYLVRIKEFIGEEDLKAIYYFDRYERPVKIEFYDEEGHPRRQYYYNRSFEPIKMERYNERFRLAQISWYDKNGEVNRTDIFNKEGWYEHTELGRRH